MIKSLVYVRLKRFFFPPSQVTSNSNATTGCCSCQFEDTQYMSYACGGNSSTFMTLIQNVMSSRCDVADPCRRLGSNKAPKENEWYKIYRISQTRFLILLHRFNNLFIVTLIRLLNAPLKALQLSSETFFSRSLCFRDI